MVQYEYNHFVSLPSLEKSWNLEEPGSSGIIKPLFDSTSFVPRLSQNLYQHVSWSPKGSATMLDSFAQLFQHCWDYTWSPKSLDGICPSHDVLWRSHHFWELLHAFAHHCQHGPNNSQHCWPNNVESCSVRLHVASPSKISNWA